MIGDPQTPYDLGQSPSYTLQSQQGAAGHAFNSVTPPAACVDPSNLTPAPDITHKWTAPANGTLALALCAGFDSVLLLYRAGSGTSQACNDDGSRGAAAPPLLTPPGRNCSKSSSALSG